MHGFERISSVDDLIGRNPLRITVDDLEIVVFKVGPDFFAVENNCPHQHFRMLHEGTLEGCSLTCPMHGWTFDLRTGKSATGDGRLNQRRVRVIDSEVWIEKQKRGISFPLLRD